MTIELHWHKYRYFPYEKELALREVRSLLTIDKIDETRHALLVEGQAQLQQIERLAYFSKAVNGHGMTETLQSRLEHTGRSGQRRQATRYSVHGLHEYKGKFNPQVARAMLNIMNVQPGQLILDPFCGSGTSLVECAHMGIRSVGVDINPLAVFVANAKLHALSLPAERIRTALDVAIKKTKVHTQKCPKWENARGEYLLKWFPEDTLTLLDNFKAILEEQNPEEAPILLSLASDLLRDYSFQDPNDLRIRRRKSPLPDVPFFDALRNQAATFIDRLRDMQDILGSSFDCSRRAINLDIKQFANQRATLGIEEQFDGAITSPPYATALPYIDTQRLSLAWLGLLEPSDIGKLEAELVGSRELKGVNKKSLLETMQRNSENIPQVQAEYCLMLERALGESDGFRRLAVPMLLYRYFSEMQDALASVKSCMKPGAFFALIVGSNHTVLGGTRFDIDTPAHLAEIAEHIGWTHEESIPLQTYQRYGYHMNNAVASESLIILRS